MPDTLALGLDAARGDGAARPLHAPETFHALTVPVEPGVTLVEASAGTGKTYAITELVLRLVLDPAVAVLDGPDGQPDLRRLLVVTFTVAATEELKTRIRAALRTALDAFETGEASGVAAPFLAAFGATEADRARSVLRLRHALAQVGEAAVFTIHGFCKRVLERSAFESGEPFAFDFTEDAERLRHRAARDVWHRLVGQHGALGGLSVAAGWTLDRFLDHASYATRYVRTEVVPPAEPVAEALARFETARAALADAWDAETALAAVPPARAAKKTPFANDPDGLAARVAAFAAGETRHLESVRQATTAAAVEAVTYKNRAPGKAAAACAAVEPGFLACDAVVAAVDDLERALVHAVVGGVEEAYRTLKQRAGVLTFDDLVGRLAAALAPGAPTRADLVRSIQAQFAVALVDEFQDTDPQQVDVFRTAFEGRPLVLVGDPKQAIYAFRGADVFAYLDAKRVARRTYTLSTNYRSAPALVDAVNALFARLGPGGRPFVYDGIPFQPVAPAPGATPALTGVEPAAPLVWWTGGHLPTNRSGVVSKDPARQAVQEAVVTEICRLLTDPSVRLRDRDGTERPLQAGDLAVLVKKNQQARDLQDALRRAGVPSVVGRGSDVRLAHEMDELERVLRAVAHPHSRRTVRAALATELWGWTGADLATADDARTDRVADALRRDRAVWRDRGVFQMLTGLFRREGMAERLRGYADHERRMTNLRHAMELLHEAEASAGRSVDELLHWVRTRADREVPRKDSVEMRLESDAAAVQLVTMHNAKGLEYPVVFAPFVWDEASDETWFGTFVERPPVAHVDGGRGAVYDLGSDDQAQHRALADAERLAESLRLTYVALTRARERLYIAWGPFSGGHMSGLGHLLRDLPLPLTSDDADGGTALASLDAALKTQASNWLRDAHGALGLWLTSPLAPRHHAAVPLPDGGGHVEAVTPVAAPLPARTLAAEARRRAERHAATGSFSAWASGASDDRHDDTGLEADAADDRAPDDTPETGLFAFAAGARAGTCLHEVLQYADFAVPSAYLDLDPDPEAWPAEARRVTRTLRVHGLAADTAGRRVHRAPVDAPRVACALVGHLATTEIPGWGFRLADVAPTARARDTEWTFVAPRTEAAPSAIADVFEAHGGAELQGYAPALRRLRDGDAERLFVGTADLVVQHPADETGRFYLFDWKSNHLGSTPAHYGPDALARAMRSHHYLLQAHLYAVGLHRHLRARLGAAYDPAQHLGGVAYVFLRAVAAPRADSETGIWTSTPSPALLDALDALLFLDA